MRRRTGTFTDETLQAPVFGCGFTVSGSFKRAGSGGDAITRLRHSLESQRWEEMADCGTAEPTTSRRFLPQTGIEASSSA